MGTETDTGSNFIEAIIEDDLASGRHTRVVTRFPPEPNGYLHIGHAKAICLDFGLAEKYGGRCHLRFDDTNPTKEEQRYVDAIQADLRWLGFHWGEHLYFASDYFERMYELAEGLVLQGKAYVDSLTDEQIREHRGTVTEAGKESPFRDRSVEENVDLLRRMRAGEFPDGAHVLRAKIDLGSPNMKMRDPLLYRIRHARHHRTGDDWCIYPMYDWAHPLEDAIEGVTHSLCTLEFDVNRELYDWVLDNVDVDWDPRPHQYEFARLALNYTVMSKRRFLELVQDGHVAGWDDPRMPTLAGLRRRGVPPEAIREFAERVGVSKANSTVDLGLFESVVRDDLNTRAPRAMAVLDPLEVVIETWEGAERFDVPSWPPDVGHEGSRTVPFGRRIFIERDDFAEDPPKGFFRLAPGREVRLRSAFLVTCTGVDKDEHGRVVRLRCSHDPASRGGTAPDGRKVKGTLHWVPADQALDAEVRLYDRLFAVEDLGGEDWLDHLNPESLRVVTAKVEPSLAAARPGDRFQFERQGYFAVDPDSEPGHLVFNRVVALKDSWARRTAPPRLRSRDQAPVVQLAAPEAVPRERPPRDHVQDARFKAYLERGVAEDDADLLARDGGLAHFFQDALAVHTNAQGVANWIVNELGRELKDRDIHALPFDARAIGELVSLMDAGTISSRIAKDVFAVLLSEGGRPKEIVEKRGWEQVSDTSALEPIVEALIARHPAKVEEYRGGRTGLLGFFVGQVMKETGGTADPVVVKELLGARLG